MPASVCLLVSLALSLPAADAPDAAGYAATVEPFLKTYCHKCHVGDKPKGDFRVDAASLANNFLDAAAKAKWREVVNALNGHEMPPEKERQPSAAEVAAVVEWITAQAVRAELDRRDSNVVLRRLNRDEYRNTIRDLLGVDFDVSGFPQDPPAGGFDNNGGALTMSPLHVETYLNAARQILDLALVEGERPPQVTWRFDPKVGDIDRTRQKLDDRNNAIVNGGQNTADGDWVVIHHNSWNKTVGARDFRVPAAGNYVVRVRAAGRTPNREQVVASAAAILARRQAEQDQNNPAGAKFTQQQYERDLAHFQTDRMYDYGPPRIKLVLQLGPQTRTVAEFDATGTPDKPETHEFTLRMTEEKAGLHFEYAYAIPAVLENFWLQSNEAFARPELLIDWFELSGPVYDAWPPASHVSLLFPSPLAQTNERQYAAEVLRRFMRRAYRRPVTPEEVAAKLKHFDAAQAEGLSLVQAIKRPLTAVLASPHFLFLVETAGSGQSGPRALTDHELAARLSYFLWSSLPDETLSRAADSGALQNKQQRMAQVERLLADDRSEAFVRNFAGQWLALREVGANPPATDLYPQYDRHLETSIVRESEAFFGEILRHDLDARNFIRSNFVTVNERLARFYGIDGVRGDEFRRVAVAENVHRGGIVTQASMLTTTSNGTRTSPVKRGVWIMKSLLGIDPGLPVANVGEIAPKVPGFDKATVRQRLEIHRQLEQCARCHDRIDPLGFALENYNACGEWREREGFGYKGRIERNDPLIDASSQMIDGTKINGVSGLQEALLQQQDLFLQCLASKMLTYALGRELGLADQPTVGQAVAHMKANKHTLRSLIQFIATSRPFETK